MDLETLVASTVSELGGLDIAIANAGWTKFSTFGDMDALDDGEWDRCWQANVMGPRHLLRAAMPTFKANKDGGVFLISSSIAGVSIGGSSMAYSVTKAAQLHMMKCLASTQGAEGKVRINAVLPGLLLTDWVSEPFPPSAKGGKEVEGSTGLTKNKGKPIRQGDDRTAQAGGGAEARDGPAGLRGCVRHAGQEHKCHGAEGTRRLWTKD